MNAASTLSGNAENGERHRQKVSAAVVQNEPLAHPVEKLACNVRSSSLSAALAADCDRCTVAAAAVVLPLNATARKICSWRKVTRMM